MPPTTSRSRPPRLGAADLALLGFAAEHHAILAAQAAALQGVAEATARGRLARLRAAGLLDECATLEPLPRLHRITARGLRAISSPLSAPRRQTLFPRHDLALGWLWLAARAGVFGPLAELHSERAIRAAEGRAAQSHPAADQGWEPTACAPAVRPIGPAPRGPQARSVGFAHTPDMVALSAGGRRIAFELELSLKPARRLEQIIAAYAGDRRYDLVVYLTDDPRVAERVRAAARRLGCEEIFRVARVSLPAMLGSGHAAAAARSHRRIRARSAQARGSLAR